MNIWDVDDFSRPLEEELETCNKDYTESDFELEKKEFMTGKVIENLDMICINIR